MQSKDDAALSFFVQKRLRLVPRITIAIVLELTFMFFYICFLVALRGDFPTQRQHAMAWLMLIVYFTFWAKLAYSFMVLFGRIVRDTKITGESNPIEETYTLLIMAAACTGLGAISWYYGYNHQDGGGLLYLAPLLWSGTIIKAWHAWLLRDFHTEPSEQDLKKSQ